MPTHPVSGVKASAFKDEYIVCDHILFLIGHQAYVCCFLSEARLQRLLAQVGLDHQVEDPLSAAFLFSSMWGLAKDEVCHILFSWPCTISGAE